MMKMSDIITIKAPVNIAVIKYWGKRDEELILPLNDSVSMTLDTSVMCAKTSVCAKPTYPQNILWLNGKIQPFTNRIQNCLDAIKSRAAAEKSVDEDFLSWNLHICSENNFPTAAGLASSAAGYACLVTALAKLYKVKSDISSLARLGSGSACRSVFGGFVRWCAGTNPDGSDSIATVITDHTDWTDMRSLILVVGDKPKHVSSTEGMRSSVETSELLKYRVKHVVPQRVNEIIEAIKSHDFPKFAEITMRESNQFHAVCLDSYPPFTYLSETSFKIINVIHKYNEYYKEARVAYTFDAGPNACLYLLEKEVPKVLSLIKHVFPTTTPDSYITGLSSEETELESGLLAHLNELNEKDLLKYIIHTKIGDGPQEVTDGSHLLNHLGLPC